MEERMADKGPHAHLDDLGLVAHAVLDALDRAAGVAHAALVHELARCARRSRHSRRSRFHFRRRPI